MSDADRDDPVVWMLLMERGRRTNNFDLASQAKRELARLGIRIVYSRRLAKRTAIELAIKPGAGKRS